MITRKIELFTSFMAAALSIEKHLNEGWALDPESPPTDIGFRYEVSFTFDGTPKRSREEILAAARAAKAANKAAKEEN